MAGPPARVCVIGAGVAGLQAIATAKRLGAIVSAFDVRAAVKEQVQSLGATFIEVDEAASKAAETVGGYAKEMSPAFIKAEMEMFAAQAKDVDIIVTTALIPNKPAPKLITEAMVKTIRTPEVMRALEAQGSVPVGSSPAEFGDFVKAELAKWAKVAKDSGAKAE